MWEIMEDALISTAINGKMLKNGTKILISLNIPSSYFSQGNHLKFLALT